MAKKLLVIDRIVGRNGVDDPLSLPDDQCVEAINIDWAEGGVGRRRPGSASGTPSAHSFTGVISTLIRHQPGAAATSTEQWMIDNAATPIVDRRTAGGTAGTLGPVTMSDNIATRPQDVNGVSFNGKLFLFYDSTVDRLHVWDPNLGTPRVRRVGFATPAAPTAANTGAGAYAAVLRYYRVRWLQLDGTTVYRRSEAGASVSFTPSGIGAAARITQPAVAGEQETHWEIEASTDNVTFYRLAQVAIATTTHDDTAATTTYSSGTLSDIAGTHTVPTSAKYGITDGNRLLIAGAWETSGAKHSRVWFTPVLGSADAGDDERIPNTSFQKNWIDINENAGGAITGFGGPLHGIVYVFKQSQIWKLIPTGDVNAPYIPRIVSESVGCLNQKTVMTAPDENGNPAIYFLSNDGPYRVGAAGLQYLGRDIEDQWAGNGSIYEGQRFINLSASNVIAHGAPFLRLRQIYWWIATHSGGFGGGGATSASDPDLRLVFHIDLGRPVGSGTVRGGWALHTGDASKARCSSTYYNTDAGTTTEQVYFGRSSGTTILSASYGPASSGQSDSGTTYQAYIKTKPLMVAQLGQNAAVGQTFILARVASSVTLTQTIDRDFNAETVTATAVLTAAASETRKLLKVEGSQMASAGVLQFQWGDAAAGTTYWVINAVSVPLTPQEVR